MTFFDPHFSLDWRPFKDEEDIEKLLASQHFNDSARDSFRAAIIFQDGLMGSNSISYKIRMVDQDSGQDTALLFPWFQIPGPGYGKHRCMVFGSF